MSVKVYAIGDCHFKINNQKETDEMTKAILDSVEKINPDIIVMLGDTLDRHESIHSAVQKRAVEFLRNLSNMKKTYLLIGNHDRINNSDFLSETHPFVALKQWHNIVVVDKVCRDLVGNKVFTFVPYVYPGRFIEALQTFDDNPEGIKLNTWLLSDCIFAHQEIKGCKMGAIISEEGDEWHSTYPFIVSGHIHDYQECGLNVIYTGTPMQHGFGDTHDKTVSVFEFFEDKKFPIQTRIDLQLRKKQIVYLTCEEVSEYSPREGCDLKITIKGTSGELKAIKSHQNVKEWKKHHKVVYKDIPLEKNSSEAIYIKQHGLTYSQVLYNTISQDLDLVDLFVAINGGKIEKSKILNPAQETSTNFDYVS